MSKHRRFSEDEKINMKLRRDAGESMESIADDYDCAVATVQYHTSPGYREGVRAYQRAYKARRKCPKS